MCSYMGLKQKTVYFREEDLELWDAVENKADWLHRHLTNDKKLDEYMATVKSTEPHNIKENPDGTISPIDPRKPSSYISKPIPKPYKRNHDMSMDVEDQTRVDDDPDWGA